MDKLLPVHCTI